MGCLFIFRSELIGIVFCGDGDRVGSHGCWEVGEEMIGCG